MPHPSLLAACFAAALATFAVAAPPPPDTEGRDLLASAQKLIRDYHEAAPRTSGVIRVVYFHPADRDPLPDYAARLDRALNDVSDFYRDGFRRLGVESDGLPFERRDGRIALHIVRGKQRASAYQHESDDLTVPEIREALRSTFDLDREHVLILYALCRREPDGRYVFDAPYYGSGSHRSGVCHAADCELLDPKFLTEKKRRIVFTEHYYPRRDETLATFNSMYLGGIAHELGHGLGLFHDDGTVAERSFGEALMGGGNLTYREDLHGGKRPAFFSRVSALHLLSHPLITRSDRGRWDEIGSGIDDLTFTSQGGALRIRGHITAAIPAYAVVAYLWSTNTTDHSSRTYPTMVQGDRFELDLAGMRRESTFMRLVSLHVNGGAVWSDYRLGFDAQGAPETPRKFTWPWIVAHAEKALMERRPQARALLVETAPPKDSTPDEQRMLTALRRMLEPEAPLDLAKVQANSVYLSDVRWTDARVGWGQPARNHTWFDEKVRNGALILVAGQFFDKGLYAHAASRFAYPLDRQWKKLTAVVGLRDGAPDFGTTIFRVIGDGRELFRSPVLRAGERADVSVDVTGVRTLELLAEGDRNNHGAWSIWAAPQLHR